MTKPTLDELHARLGTQPAEYIEEYCREHHAHAVPCGICGKLTVLDRKPTKRQLAAVRCGDCDPRPPLEMQR